ncbi:unnamed protein product, partial [Owenia fusiformis]
VKSPVLWQTKYRCDRDVLDKSDFQNPGPNTLSRVMNSPFCSVEYIAPSNDNLQPRPCIPTIHTCPDGTDRLLAYRCANSNLDPYSTYKQQYHAYHNWYCFICTEPERPLHSCTVRLSQISQRSSPDLSLFSFKIMVDVTSDNEIRLRSQAGHGIVGLDVEVGCNSDNLCKALTCPKAYIRAGGKCKLVSTIVPVQINCYLSIELEEYTFHVIKTYIKQIFDPVGLILIRNGPDYDQFTFNASFPENYTSPQIYKKMASDSERMKEKAGIAFTQLMKDINITYDVSFIKHKVSHVTEKVPNSGSQTGSGMAWMFYIFLFMKIC